MFKHMFKAILLPILICFYLVAYPGNVLAANQDFVTLPIKPFEWTNSAKLQQARCLAGWVKKILAENKAQVAVIARTGPPLTTLFDKTGMTHTGLVFRHPQTQDWMVYSLYSNPENDYKTALLWRQTLDDFFYGQRGHKKEALVLIPSQSLQEKALVRFYRQPFPSLLPSDHHYNLVAPVEHPQSFNCIKWILLQLYAAQLGTDDLTVLLKAMAEQEAIPVIKPGPLTRMLLFRKPDVIKEELGPSNSIQTPMVKSLYHSSLFEKRLLFSQE